MSSTVPLPMFAAPIRFGCVGPASPPLAASRCLPLRLAVEEVQQGQPNRINQQRLCFVVSYS